MKEAFFCERWMRMYLARAEMIQEKCGKCKGFSRRGVRYKPLKLEAGGCRLKERRPRHANG